MIDGTTKEYTAYLLEQLADGEESLAHSSLYKMVAGVIRKQSYIQNMVTLYEAPNMRTTEVKVLETTIHR